MAKLSVELERYFLLEERGDIIFFDDILLLAGDRIFGFLLLILSLPSALPIPAPGYSIPFGILILLLAIQFMIGYQIPWLPNRFKRGKMKTVMAKGFVEKGLPWLKRLETITKPRLTSVCNSHIGKIVLGGAIALMAISMMIPIPGTNTAPAVGIFITAFGLQEDDGFICLLGLIVCIVAGCLSASIIFGAIVGSSSLWQFINK
ncbi:exopolysaccharide biosynthesis protein [Cyanobacterium stanieri LEGE 03274]|uniref:Exopolysaccharide biosynthesis protein n=1 Tax=Cyanobacterium stanieri LEGE 03274 TaxID=1828756 RepID=A0ABR9V0N8_9CHRO|nr:exopolysaccharide biosynthesis protein [Cyanobacterium stanieri]MBE9221139.1 exopolysaccharide biosynthesis protein [Cyanobacterium stanieri LEGE 03274]